jgi:TP901-1 family phage major tail protein
MIKMNLQLFAAEAVHGSKLIYLYRILEEAATNAATVIMLSTEDEISFSKDFESTSTKDGAILTPGEEEVEKSGTSLLAVGDEMYDKIKQAMKENKKFEVWEVNLAEPGTGDNKFKSTYYQGYATEFTKTSASDSHVECETTFKLQGFGADGEATVTQEQQEIAAYQFKDTTAAGA